MIKRLFGNIFTPILIIILIIIFFISYFVSLIIIKPRDITPIVRLLDYQLSNDFEINIERAQIAWNKRSFTFDINLLQTTISNKSFSSFIPILTLDISRRNLLIGKILIDKINVPKFSISLKEDSQINSKNFNKLELQNYISKLINSDISKLSILHNINIYKLELSQKNLLHEFDNIKFNFIDNKRNKETILNFSYKIDKDSSLYFKSSCLITKKYVIEICDLMVNNVKKSFFPSRYQSEKLDFSNIDLNLKIINNENLKFITDLIITDFKSKYNEKIISYPELSIAGDIIHNAKSNQVNLKISANEKNSNIKIIDDHINERLKFELSGANFTNNEIYLFWPQIYASKIRAWLEKSISNTDLGSFSLFLDINKKNKKLNNISGEFNLKKADLKFAKKIKDLKDINAKILIDNQIIKIHNYEAKLENEIISDFTAKINYKIKPLELLIKGNIDDIRVNNIVTFLLEEKLSNKQLNKITENFNALKLDGDLALNIKIIKPFDLKNIAINFTGDAKGIIKNYIPKNSNTKIILDKKYNDNFKINADLQAAYFSLPYVKNIKAPNIPLNVKLDVIATKENLNFHNIIITNQETDIQGKVEFFRGKLNKINFDDSKFYENKFSINLELDDKILSGKIISDRINLDDEIFKLSSKQEDKNLKLDILIDKLYLNNSLFKISGNINCHKICQILYIEAYFNKNDHFILKKSSSYKKKSQIDFVTNNLGALLKNLNITNKLKLGDAQLEMSEIGKSEYDGVFSINDFRIENNNFFKKISSLDPFKKINIAEVYFNKGRANFSVDKENILIKNSLFYGNILGVNLNGRYDREAKNFDMEGYLIPAYKLNNLFGVSDIPVFGKILTGKDNQGLVSAKFTVKGNKKKQDLNINPFSAFIPSALKNIGDLFKKNNN